MLVDFPRKKTGQGLTVEALDALLGFLDRDRDRAGEKYEELRLRITKYFEWEGCAFVEDHADETINRVARAIHQGKEIRDLGAYCFGVARLIRFELLRAGEKERRAVAELAEMHPAAQLSEQSDSALECLAHCLDMLPPESKELITKYYHGDQIGKIRNRKGLAEALGLGPNALRNRALRLRLKLERCVVGCLNDRDESVDSGTNI